MGLSVNFAGGVTPWVGMLIAAAAIALTLLSYIRTETSSRGHKVFLTALRLFGVVILLLVALKPLVTYKTEKEREGEMALLVDTSGSMGVRDYPNMPSRLESVKSALAVDTPQMRTLKKRFDISVRTFDERPGAEVAAADTGGLAATGRATHIAAALNAAAEAMSGRGGIIVFTDGVETAETPLEYTGSVPVLAVGVGSRLSAEGTFKDVILSNVEVLPAGEPVVSKDNIAEIAAYIEGLGYGGTVVPVRLKDNTGAVLSERSVALDTARGEQKIVLSYTPREKGNFKLTVEIPPQGEETIVENNYRNLNVTVTDPRIKVLYVEGTLRSEYRYIARVLQRDPNVRMLALVRLSERTFYQQGNVTDMELTGFPQDRETLEKFDVIMIGDLPASALSRTDMENIREVVSAGAGLLMLGGYNSFADGGYGGTAVADALPVDVTAGAGGQDKNEFVPELTGEGEVSGIFAGITEYFGGADRRAARELPTLLGQAKIGRPKPAATVLAVNPLRSDAAGQLPVLVVETFGSGRSAALAVDTTWRWYSLLRGRDMESPYVRFWGQLIRWLAKREVEEESGQPGVTAWLDKAFYALGDSVTVTADVRGGDGLTTDKAAVSAVVEGPGGFEMPLGHKAGSRGTYEAHFTPKEAGNYVVKVSAAEGGSGLGEAEAAFEVGVEDVEMRRIDLDEGHLRKVAGASGGAYVGLLEWPGYVARLKATGEREKTVEVLNLRQRRVLYPLFLIFVALVTVEWGWRKRLELP